MPIISVSGATSRAGKTSLAVTLSRGLPPGSFNAVKFTTTEDEHTGCARGSPCTVCDIDVDFRLITDPSVLGQQDTDTARLVASGAATVLWCICKFSAMRRAWDSVAEKVSSQDIVLVEGSTILETIRPELSFYVINPSVPLGRWKPSSRHLIPRCDFICINCPAGKRSHKPIDRVLEEVRRLRNMEGILIEDVQRELASWSTSKPLERLRSLQLSASRSRLSTTSSPSPAASS